MMLGDFIAAPLTPKRADDKVRWIKDSLAARFHDATEDPGEITLSRYVEDDNDLAELRFAFDELVRSEWSILDNNTKTILGDKEPGSGGDFKYPAIRDYLVARGYYAMELNKETSHRDKINGLKIFVLHNRAGMRSVVDYAIVSAARTTIADKALIVPGYNDDNSDIVGAIKSAKLSLASVSFKPSLLALVEDYISYDQYYDVLKGTKLAGIPDSLKPQLVKYIKQSPGGVGIDRKNIDLFLPLFLSQIQGPAAVDETTAADTAESDRDFDVDFLTDDTSLIQVSRSAVKCAAQLFYSMVVGDELDVFSVVNYFTHKYVIRGGIEVLDSQLRDDLQMYVFSDRFTDLKTKRIADRTRPAERQMFYRQVFNYGNARITDDVIVNREFPRLWKLLMLESANYLERAQASPHPDSFVSPQKVQQAVEDLQYNLSTHCTGMANVITPLIYAELNFVISRILMHREVVRQVVPVGGTWWRVVEKLYMEMKHARPKATVLYGKAKLGVEIIKSIADYDAPTFVEGGDFSTLIGNVDAFITTQSILQESLTDDLKRGDDETGEDSADRPAHDDAGTWDGHANGHSNGNGQRPRVPAMAGAPAGTDAPPSDEWDF